MGLWETFGKAFQEGMPAPKNPTIPKSPQTEDSDATSRGVRDIRAKGSNLSEGAGNLLFAPDNSEAEHSKPEAIRQGKRILDHAEFCPRYWRGCFSCSSYLPPNTDAAIACGPFFCRKMNVMRFGSELVELAQI